MARRRGGNDKFKRLTGLWQSKRDGLWTGNVKDEALDDLKDLVDAAIDGSGKLTLFLWENDKGGRKDPEFTVQATVGDDDKGGRSRGRGRDRGDDNDRGDEREARGSDRKSNRRSRDEDDKKGSSKRGKKEDW